MLSLVLAVLIGATSAESAIPGALEQSLSFEVRLRQVSGQPQSGGLPSSAIESTLQKQRKSLFSCVLEAGEAIRSERIRVKGTISPGGTLDAHAAGQETAGEPMSRCIAEGLSAMTFPRARRATRVSVYVSIHSEQIYGVIRAVAREREHARRVAAAKLTTFHWPVDHKKVNSKFGKRWDPTGMSFRPQFHTGVDLRAKWGASIRASASGHVKEAGWHGTRGKQVVIEHRGGVRTGYGHLSTILVRPGQFVQAGQLIARAGSTGRSTGPHLHFEVVVANNKKINPLTVLGKTVSVSRLMTRSH